MAGNFDITLDGTLLKVVGDEENQGVIFLLQSEQSVRLFSVAMTISSYILHFLLFSITFRLGTRRQGALGIALYSVSLRLWAPHAPAVELQIV